MKFLLFILFFISCTNSNKEITYGWENYTDAQKASIEAAQRAQCQAEFQENLNQISSDMNEHFQQSGSNTFYKGLQFSVNITEGSDSSTPTVAKVTVIRIGDQTSGDPNTVYFFLENQNKSLGPINIFNTEKKVIKYTMSHNQSHLNNILEAACSSTEENESYIIENSLTDTSFNFLINLRSTITDSNSNETIESYSFNMNSQYIVPFKFFNASYSKITRDSNNAETSSQEIQTSIDTNSIVTITDTAISDLILNNGVVLFCEYTSFAYDISSNLALSIPTGSPLCTTNLFSIPGI